MVGVPYTFSAATAPIPLSQLDANFNTTLTIGSTSIGLGNTTSSLANITFTGTTTLPGSGAISSAGLLGIGMTPTNILDITQTQNAQSIASLTNANASTAAVATLRTKNDAGSVCELGMFGSGYTPSGVFRASGGYVYTNGAGGLTLTTGAAQPIYFGINGSEVARFTTTNLLALYGPSSGTGYAAQFYNGPSGSVDVYFEQSNGSASTTSGTIRVSKNSSNSRSINATGTINASGADYAEYMVKAEGCGVIAKGNIVGVNASGNLTDKFSEAHSFVIKSTNPSYVGGDSWSDGNPAVGPRPEPTSTEDKAEKAVLEAELVKWKERHEAARATVDRIAFSGQVPVNVTGAAVGDYIVPVADPDGGITGQPVTNPAFDQYRAAVGRVWKILEDGRAFVSVKVS
jgi:hypothetical protein